MKQLFRPLRSVLYMPASNSRAIEKSLTTLKADAFIYDLEDSVGHASKPTARENLWKPLFLKKDSNAELSPSKVVRINATSSPYFADDVSFLNSLTAAENSQQQGALDLDTVLLAKAETREDIVTLENAIAPLLNAKPELDIWCMVETPLGVCNVFDVLQSSQKISTVVLGLEDLCNDMKLKPRAKDRFNLMYPIQQVLLAAKALSGPQREINVIDGVYTDLNNEKGFEQESIQAMELGMVGKTLIHPKTIETANRVFSPSVEEIQKAERMIQCFEDAEREGKGVAVLDDTLVEELHVRRARKMVETAKMLHLL